MRFLAGQFLAGASGDTRLPPPNGLDQVSGSGMNFLDSRSPLTGIGLGLTADIPALGIDPTADALLRYDASGPGGSGAFTGLDALLAHGVIRTT
jgi:hypothetical protein